MTKITKRLSMINILKVMFDIGVIMVHNEIVQSCKYTGDMGLNGDVILWWAIENAPLLLGDTKDLLHNIACLSML